MACATNHESGKPAHIQPQNTDLNAPLPVVRNRICMLAYTNYEADGRVRRYAEALARRGDHVEVIALSSGPHPLGTEEISGVTVFRIQRREHDEQSKWAYAWRLLRFLVVSSLFLARRHLSSPFKLIHVHNVPDFLVFAAWYPKLTGAKLILDIHDIVPELFVSKFGARADGFYIRLLRLVEKMSIAFSDHVIVSNHLWRDRLLGRSVSEDKCSVFLNYVDPAIFFRRIRTRDDGKLILLFPGTFQWHQGLDIAIEALTCVKKQIPSAELHLYGGGGVESDLMAMAAKLGLSDSVRFCGGVPFECIADVIANADIGIVPKRANSFGNEAYSTKIMEFMSQGVPVVISRTKIDTYYFDDSLVRFFPSGDCQAMAEAIVQVFCDTQLREKLVARGLEYVEKNSWVHKESDYFRIIDCLVGLEANSLRKLAHAPTPDLD